MSAWDKLKLFTNARVGLGRVGSALPTKRVLEFQRAHAAARRSLNLCWDSQDLEKKFHESGEKVLTLNSQIRDRETYLRFPNKGRALDEASISRLRLFTADLALVVSDGLSTLAIQNHFWLFWKEFAPILKTTFPELHYQLVFIPYGRVAISDEVGETLKAKMSIIFLGERPGLDSPDSMGIYMTYQPQLGNSDAQRNCISNVREPQGLHYPLAANKLIWLMKESLRLQLSGVHLKDNQPTTTLDFKKPTAGIL